MKAHYYCTYPLIILLLLSSCNQQKSAKEKMGNKSTKIIELKTYVYKKKYEWKPNRDLGSLTFDAKVELPIDFYNQEVLENVEKYIVSIIFKEKFNYMDTKSILPSYGDRLFEDYKTYDDYLEELDTLDANDPQVIANSNNQISIEGSAIYKDDKILAYSYERTGYLGGAHGFSENLLYNFNLTDATLIKEKDIFKTNYKASLTQLIRGQIVEDNASIESIADLSDFNYYEENIIPNNNFLITKEGLLYVYNEYEIAPYYIGQTTVLLPYSKIRPILRPNNIIEHIYNPTTK